MSEETTAAKTPGQIACDAWFDTSAPQDVAWDNAAEAVAAPLRARIGELEAQLADCQRKNAALAAAGIRKHDVVCHFADAFSKSDDRRMRHASVTESTIARWCADAGIRP